MSAFEQLLGLTTGPLNYVCAEFDEIDDPQLRTKLSSIGGVRFCSKCEKKVAVTPSVLAEHKALAHSLGRELAIVCGSCGEAMMAESPLNLVRLPTDLEDAEAQRIMES